MNYKMKLKQNKGITLTDIVIAIVILVVFMGILTSTIIQIYKHNVSIRIDAYVVDCSVKICEYIDEMKYADVNNTLTEERIRQLLEEKYENYEVLDNYKISIEVENYNENGSNIEDLIKKVKVSIEYENIGEIKTYTINKLKIKEV